MIWWEDFEVGKTSEMGSHRFTEEEIVAFARQFDPQPFHTAYRRTVLESRASGSRPGVGLVKHRWEALNQDGERVLSMEGWGRFGRRPAL